MLLAMGLWVFVNQQQRRDLSIDIPIEIQNIPSGLRLTKDLDPQVLSLKLNGPKFRLIRLQKEFLGTYRLDFHNAKKGINTFFIHEEDFGLPHKVHLSMLVPQVIRVELVEVAQESDNSIKNR